MPQLIKSIQVAIVIVSLVFIFKARSIKFNPFSTVKLETAERFV